VPSNDLPARLADVAAAAPGLRLLLLFGSRARGDQRATSDWDLGYVGTDVFDPDGFLAALVDFNLGAPASYADMFRRLAQAGAIDGELAARLSRAAGFRNVVAHAYDQLDMIRVFQAAKDGPADLRALLAALRNRLG